MSSQNRRESRLLLAVLWYRFGALLRRPMRMVTCVSELGDRTPVLVLKKDHDIILALGPDTV